MRLLNSYVIYCIHLCPLEFQKSSLQLYDSFRSVFSCVRNNDNKNIQAKRYKKSYTNSILNKFKKHKIDQAVNKQLVHDCLDTDVITDLYYFAFH